MRNVTLVGELDRLVEDPLAGVVARPCPALAVLQPSRINYGEASLTLPILNVHDKEP